VFQRFRPLRWKNAHPAFQKMEDIVKGRDWYDMKWYVRKGVSLNLKHFALRAKDSGDWEQQI
jgi:hypothetical protein